MTVMSPTHWHRIQEILDLYDETPPAARPGFLARISEEDAELGREVRALVGNDDKLEDFIETPLFPIATPDLGGAVFVPRVGPYTLLKELGCVQ